MRQTKNPGLNRGHRERNQRHKPNKPRNYSPAFIGATIAHALKGRRYGNGLIACCPAHNDKEPSLCISLDHGHLVFDCRGGCGRPAIIKALKKLKLWPEQARGKFDTRHDFTSRKLAYELLKLELESGKSNSWSPEDREAYEQGKRIFSEVLN